MGGTVTLADIAIEGPVLTSKCGGALMLGSWSDGSFDGPIFYFEPVG